MNKDYNKEAKLDSKYESKKSERELEIEDIISKVEEIIRDPKNRIAGEELHKKLSNIDPKEWYEPFMCNT